MALTPGTRIGPYEVIALLGVGGMGEVYRARDPKLNREVAIKVLLAAVANDPERLDRFGREAQVLASLNHPNIAQIYGIEDANGVRALVMELVEGPTLADRIAYNAIPVEEALPIAKQIAEALEAAHDLGIIHRDLKPANVKVRADGTVKVLDFGLAKALDPPADASVGAANSPTLSMQATAAGVILGTAAYMAPEQARGKPVDKRADIWAFGCVLFEMLTGRRAFHGDDVTDTIVAVVSKEPDWTALPAGAAVVRSLLARCLKKERKQRLQAIGDARILIDELINGTSEGWPGSRGPVGAPSRRATPAAIAVVAGVAAIAAVVTWALTRPAPQAPAIAARFEIVPPAAQALAPQGADRDIAVSPDGRYIVYRAGGGLLIVRTIGQLDTQPIAGVTNARQPFFSPDSRWIGFFEGTALKKVAVTGGAVVTLAADMATPRGASWDHDNSIVFATIDPSGGLMRVSANGGEPRVVTRSQQEKGGRNHWYPSVLPGGRGILFTVAVANRPELAEVGVLDLKTGQTKTLVRGSQAEYVQTGHLLYVAAGALHGVRFDLEQLEVLGDPVSIVDGVRVEGAGAAGYSLSQLGTLAYLPAVRPQGPRSLVWVDRKGHETSIAAPPREYTEARLSPDGTRVALTISDQDHDIWIWHLAGKTPLMRLTFDPSVDDRPVWTSDGRRIVFASMRAGPINLFAQAADGTGAVERLTTGGFSHAPAFVAADGTGVLGSEQTPKWHSDVVWFPLKGVPSPLVSTGSSDANPSPVEPLVRTPFIETNPALSPDGRYLAYQSNESGTNQIYVRPFPRVNDGRWQVSSSGGTRPGWARNGRELYYLDVANVLTAVPAQTSGTTFGAGNPARVFDLAFAETDANYSRPFDVSPDDQRFLMIKESTAGPSTAGTGIVVVLNWFEELKAKLPAK